VDAQAVGKGGVIDGLQLSDFIVKDNRAPVALRYCVQEEAHLDIALLFELSRVMAPDLADLRLASEMTLAGLREGDRVAVLSYKDDLQVEQELTGNLQEMKRKLRFGLAYAIFGRKPWVLPAVAGAAKYLPHSRNRTAGAWS
jgi:hypothetical protein